MWRDWLNELEVGNSFCSTETPIMVSNYIQRVGTETGKKFVSHKLEDGRVRIWRTE